MPQATPVGPGARESSAGAHVEASQPAPAPPGTPESASGLCGRQEPLRPQLSGDWDQLVRWAVPGDSTACWAQGPGPLPASWVSAPPQSLEA